MIYLQLTTGEAFTVEITPDGLNIRDDNKLNGPAIPLSVFSKYLLSDKKR